jgi:outer membrane protein insertion porin family/translocation and assembly module TamA
VRRLAHAEQKARAEATSMIPAPSVRAIAGHLDDPQRPGRVAASPTSSLTTAPAKPIILRAVKRQAVVALIFVALAWLAAGCARAKTPCSPADLNGCIVDKVDIKGNHALDDDDIEKKIATAETGGTLENIPILGALDALTRTDEHFDRFVLERDLARIERLYRAEGYYHARVTSGRAQREPLEEDHDRPPPDQQTPEDKAWEAKRTRVLVEIGVDEGPQTKVAAMHVNFASVDKSVDEKLEQRVEAAAKDHLDEDQGFTEEHYEDARRAALRALTDRGYAYAEVTKNADIDVEKNLATVTYTISTGPPSTFGKIEIVGLKGIPEWLIRPALGFKEGQRFSTRRLAEAQTALAEFGVFGSIAIEPAIAKGGPRPTAVPIRISVERAKKGSIKLGGGAEAGDQVAVHGVVGWQDLDLFGILDRVSVELQPRLVFYPMKLSSLFSQPPTNVVPEFTVRAQYSLPVPFEPRTTIFSQGEASISRPKNATTPDHPDEATDNILGYQEISGKFGVQRKFFRSRFLVFPSFNIQYANPFSYNRDDPPSGLQSLTIPNLELFLELDLRRNDKTWDPVKPRSGFYASTDVQVSGFFMGGDASDVRFRPEARFYVPLWKNGVLAGRAGTGLLFAKNYGATFDAPPATATVEGDDTARIAANRDIQIMQIRGLFSGGPSSNRGYGYNEIGPHRVLNDDGVLLTSAESVGGRTEWDASLEVRIKLNESFGATLFTDASDVTAGFGEYRIDHPHLSTGVGLSYDTPVGPLRGDLGFRIPGLQIIGDTDYETCVKAGTPCDTLILDEGDPDTLLGAPLALAIAIGNAF